MNIELLERLKVRLNRIPNSLFDMQEADKCLIPMTLMLADYKRRVGVWVDRYGEEVSNPATAARVELDLSVRQAEYISVESLEGDDHSQNGIFYRYDLKTPKAAAAVVQELIYS